MSKQYRLLLVLAISFSLLGERTALCQTKEAGPTARSSIADVEKAKSLLHSGKQQEAVKHLEESIAYWTEQTKTKPADAQARVDLARVLFEFQQDDKALAAIEEAKKLDPKLAAAYSLRGLMYYYAGDNARAQAEFEAAVRLEPRNVSIRIAFAEFLSSAEKEPEEKEQLQAIIEIDPTFVQAYESLSLIQSKEGKLDEEYKTLSRCVASNPESVRARQMLGQYFQTQDKPTEAYEQFAVAEKAAPEDMRSATKLLQLCAALGKSDEFDRRLKRVRELFEKNGHTEKWFCREQFKVGDNSVMAIETFKLEGPQAVLYGFYVTEKGGGKPAYRVSLGSYDSTTEVARSTGQIGKEERMFHLDFYRGREHRTYGMFAKEPSYDEARKMAIEIIEGKRKSLSSSIMPAKSAPGKTVPEKPAEKNP